MYSPTSSHPSDCLNFLFKTEIICKWLTSSSQNEGCPGCDLVGSYATWDNPLHFFELLLLRLNYPKQALNFIENIIMMLIIIFGQRNLIIFNNISDIDVHSVSSLQF